jgi:hypothetical protein
MDPAASGVSLPPGKGPVPPAPAQAPPLEAEVDRVSGRWLMRLNGLPVEVDPRLGLVSVGSRIVRWPGEPLPADPEQATPLQVRTLLSLRS